MPKDKTKRKARNELPLEKRFQIVEEYKNGKGLTGVCKLAEKFSCGKTKVSNILKQKTLVREKYERGFSSTKKRNRTSQYSAINDAVWEWFKKKTEQRTPVDGPIIQEFAMKAAEKLGYPEFKASSGWLMRFKERNNLSQHKLCDESANVPEATVYSWKERLGLLSLDMRCKTSGTWMKLAAFIAHFRIRAFRRKQRNAKEARSQKSG